MTAGPLVLQRLHRQRCRCCLDFGRPASASWQGCARCSTVGSPSAQRCPACGSRYGRGRLLTRWQERVRSRLR